MISFNYDSIFSWSLPLNFTYTIITKMHPGPITLSDCINGINVRIGNL